MKENRFDRADKEIELARYRDLVVATLDYLIDNNSLRIKTADFDSDSHYRTLKEQAIEHFEKGRLTRLKQWFRDLTAPQRETGDVKFNTYLRNRTGHDIDIFQDYYGRIDKIIAKGKITTDRQFYDISSLVDQLSQAAPVDKERLAILNKLLADYERRRKRK